MVRKIGILASRSLADIQEKMLKHVCSVMSDSLRPHRQQPARLLCPRDFSGKNTVIASGFMQKLVSLDLRGFPGVSVVKNLPASAGMKVLVAQSCPTLYDPTDYSPSGSSVHRILRARILEWVAIPFHRRSS